MLSDSVLSQREIQYVFSILLKIQKKGGWLQTSQVDSDNLFHFQVLP